MGKLIVDFRMPSGWSDISDKQLKFLYKLIAKGYKDDVIKVLCLFRWNKTKVLGRIDTGGYLLKKDRDVFEVSSVAIAELIQSFGWLTAVPDMPVRLRKSGRHKAIEADFSGVRFETFIICDNLYQGYLQTRNDELLDELGRVLYNTSGYFKDYERINIFFWFASLKNFMSAKYRDFFKPTVSDNNMLGSQALSVEDAMNAQIRALTKGDVTKETEVLALDTHRALTELNALAREYNDFNSKYGNK